MNRYFSEVARVIRSLGVTSPFDEESNLLQADYRESPLCTIGTNGIRYHPDHIDTEAKKKLLDQIEDKRRVISEYINAYEKAPPLTAEGLGDGYRLLAEYNRVVLAAKDMDKHGYQFATWNRTYGDTGLTHGHYSFDYESAKEDFAIRSGMVDENKLFTDEQMNDIYRAVNYFRWENEDITDKQDAAMKDIMEKIEYAIPGAESVLGTEQSSGMGMNM